MISVVIPLFNKGKYIARAVDSVLKQTFQEFEIVIVNDGSLDRGPEIVKGYRDTRIRLFHQQNLGQSVARNRGIEEARYDFITFLDADDAYHTHFLETIQRLRAAYPGAGAFATAYEVFYSKEKIIRPAFRGIPGKSWEGILPNYFDSALGIPPVWTSAVGVPKKIFKEIGNFLPGLRRGQDLHMWLRIAIRYPIAFSSFVGATYYLDAQWRVGDKFRDIVTAPVMLETIEREICDERTHADLKPWLREYGNWLLLTNAGDLMHAGKLQKAKRFLNVCRTKKLWSKKLYLTLLIHYPFFLKVINVAAFLYTQLRLMRRENIPGNGKKCV